LMIMLDGKKVNSDYSHSATTKRHNRKSYKDRNDF